jgi:hypothetical protein
MTKITTGSDLRDKMIREAIRVVRNADPLGEHPLDVATIAAILPADFDLLPGEIEMFANEPPIIDGEFTPAPETAAPAAEVVIEPPTPDAIEAALNAVVSATDALSQSRATLIIRQREFGAAVATRNRAVSQFRTGLQSYTPDQLRRDSARAGLEQRAAIKAGTMAPPAHPIPGNSRVDQIAAYSKGDVESNGNFRRVVSGGQRIFPASQRGRVLLPSER